MSLRSGYRSKGSWDSKRSVFDFEDEFGEDPILGRYGGSSASEELLSARAARSASEVQLAQASLDAAMRPAQVMSDFFTKMNSAVSQKADLEAKARGQAQAAQALERLGKVKDYAGYTSILTEFPEAPLDPRFKARWDAQGLSLQTKMLADFSKSLNEAATADDIIRAQGSLPVEVLADTANRERIDNLVQAAEIRVKAQRSTQAASALGSAANIDTMMRAREQYADVLGDPRVTQASARNEQQLQIEQRLRSAEIDPSKYAYRTGPEGEEMGYNFEAAERDLEKIPTQKEIGGLEMSIKRMSERKQQAADSVLGDDGVAITWTDGEQATLDFLTKQLEARQVQFYRPKNVGDTSDNETGYDFESLMPESARTRIAGAGAGAAAPAPAATAPASTEAKPAPAPEPEPEPISLEEEIAQTAEADKKERTMRSVQPKLEARKAEKESKIDKAERRLKRSNLINERERLNKAITDAGLGEETDVVKRAKARIAEINQELGE